MGRVRVERRQRDPVAGGNRSGGGGKWTREPPDRTASDAATRRQPSRLRRRAPAIEGSADRQDRDSGIARRSRSAASPNEGGTAEGTTFRPGTNGRFLIPGAGPRSPSTTPEATGPDGPQETAHDEHHRSAQPGRG